MRINSLYKFYQTHFGYPPARSEPQRYSYGRAIKDFMNVLIEVYRTGNKEFLSQYKNYQFARQLTIQFLDNFTALIGCRFNEPLKDLLYCDFYINIPQEQLPPSRKKGLIIPCPFLWNPQDMEIIFLVFSSPTNMDKELGVFKALTTIFPVEPEPIPLAKRYTYWVVSTGTEHFRNVNVIMAETLERIIKTCDLLLAS
ncbi:Uncharacterized [Moorella glycerini]|uniref:Uncharacterized protein n=1 Tax=Neomoorella stamsii TaxID=1266720 RepID=A0A9X7J3B6_9FIRM|nr:MULTISPECIES: hypothetical protein [Moorella]PRR73807.1 hypothetical protein MOST_12070 [Moorella stamsii]CEP67175.1 Uncharacterized [Moorella glycerini]